VDREIAAGHTLNSCEAIVLAASHLDSMYLPHISSSERYLRGTFSMTGISCLIRWALIDGTEIRFKSGECAKQLLVKCCTYLLMQLVDEIWPSGTVRGRYVCFIAGECH
jgi:hypothetical protein